MTRAATAADQRLDQVIEEATVDAHDESEQAVGTASRPLRRWSPQSTLVASNSCP